MTIDSSSIVKGGTLTYNHEITLGWPSTYMDFPDLTSSIGTSFSLSIMYDTNEVYHALQNNTALIFPTTNITASLLAKPNPGTTYSTISLSAMDLSISNDVFQLKLTSVAQGGYFVLNGSATYSISSNMIVFTLYPTSCLLVYDTHPQDIYSYTLCLSEYISNTNFAGFTYTNNQLILFNTDSIHYKSEQFKTIGQFQQGLLFNRINAINYSTKTDYGLSIVATVSSGSFQMKIYNDGIEDTELQFAAIYLHADDLSLTLRYFLNDTVLPTNGEKFLLGFVLNTSHELGSPATDNSNEENNSSGSGSNVHHGLVTPELM